MKVEETNVTVDLKTNQQGMLFNAMILKIGNIHPYPSKPMRNNPQPSTNTYLSILIHSHIHLCPSIPIFSTINTYPYPTSPIHAHQYKFIPIYTHP